MQLKLLCFEEHNLPNDWSPYYIYIISVDCIEVGRITLRTSYSDINYYTGHIGYEIIEKYRNNGYATNALYLLKDKINQLKYDYVWITCNPNNTYSKKVINKFATYVETVEVPDRYMVCLNNEDKVKEIYRWEID